MANEGAHAGNKLRHATPAATDAVVVRLEVEEKAEMTVALEEFQYNPSPPVSLGEDGARNSASIGRRRMQEVRLERYSSQASDDIQMAELPDNIPFFSGIPAVEVTKGILHLFRDRTKPAEERSSCMVCILGVPTHISLSDLLAFLSPVSSSLLTLQVVRDSTPNRYMMLLKFKEKNSAEQFFHEYNGRRYSSLEKAVCQLVYGSRVEVRMSSEGAFFAGSGLTEIPSCPVCLEKLDESVLTILCNHSFHTYCLTQWQDSSCPVCRYIQIPDSVGDNHCSICDSPEDLWICLICGLVGCGRYHGGHAHQHFVETQHTFAMQLGTQRVWDYIGDNYVHRLVQSKEDGKLVEVPGHGDVTDDEKVDSLQLEYTYLLTSQLESQRRFFEEKMTLAEQEAGVQLSVVQMRCKDVTAENERLEAALAELKREKKCADKKVQELSVVQTRCKEVTAENERLEAALAELEREKKCVDKKVQQLQARLSKAQSELDEEKELNKCLSDNQRLWRERITSLEGKMHSALDQKEKEIVELQDQVKDLMFYLETQKKVAEASEETRQELQEGQLVVSPKVATAGNSSATGSGGKRRGRRKH